MNGYDSKEEAVEALLERISQILEDLYQSGFDTVHDSTLEELKKTEELVRQYGMVYLAELLGELFQGLSMRRHQIKIQEGGIAGIYTQINEYLYLCEEKVVYDRGWEYYCTEKKERSM